MNQQWTILQYFAYLNFFKGNAIYLSSNKTTHEQQSEILTYSAVQMHCLYNLHSATKMYKNYTHQNITSFTHKHTNN